MSGLFHQAQSIPGETCVLCEASAIRSALCDACLADLPLAHGSRCPVCAVPAPSPLRCGRCLQNPPHYDRVVAALDYISPVDYIVGELKYAHTLAAARALAHALALALDAEPYPDIVLAMPMATSRMRERGFNQAEEIARHVCAEFGLAIARDVAHRIAAQQSQTMLPWRDRARNVRGVFRCATDLSGTTIAVIDDVMTTGATLNELAGTLKRAGAREVIGWIAARTPPRA